MSNTIATDTSSDEKYALMNELQQAVEKILEERN